MFNALMLWSLAGSVLSAPAPASSGDKCDGRTAVPVLEEMLPRARVALDLPGTEQVSVDGTSRCIAIVARTPGTARLIDLLLRGVDVPRHAVDLQVVERAGLPEA